MINTDMDSASSRRSFLAKGLAAVTVAAEPGVTADTNVAHSHEPAATSLHARIARANLVYDKPVTRSEEGMPLGNGRHGTLAWTTPTQVCLQINRVDVYGNDCHTNSFFERNNDYCGGCAYVEIDFSSSAKEVFSEDSFHQELDVYNGAMTLSGKETSVQMVAWPERDVLAAELRVAGQPRPVLVTMRMLRRLSQSFGRDLEEFAREHIAAVETRNHIAKSQLLIRDDSIVLTQEFREDKYYNKSAVAIAIEGGSAHAEIANETEIRLAARSGSAPLTVLIASASSFDPAFDVAAAALQELEAASAKGFSALKKETSAWWNGFWSRGSLQLKSEDGAAEYIEANYHYFLYVMAASSRGKFPPKFNGMIWNTGGDLRTWGAQHWFANTSCYYEALFTANRLELLDPFFDMYSGMYDACAVAARQQWGSEGIFIPETAYFNGLEKLPDDVAEEMRALYLMQKPWSERSERFRAYAETKHPHSSRWNWIKASGWVKGRWTLTERGSGPYGNVTHIFGTTAKIAYLFWRKFEFTQDKEWLRARAYPMLRGAAEFYRKHPNVKKEADSKYHIRFANSNESVWGGRDTDEDLSAMRGIFAALLRAAELLGEDSDMQPVWKDFLDNLTAMPASDDSDALRPADYRGVRVFARGRQPAVQAPRGLLPDANSLPQWFFDLCNAGSPDTEMLRLANQTFDSYFAGKISADTPVSVLSKLAIAGAILGRTEAVRYLVPNQIRTLKPERNTAYLGGGVLRNRMTLREGPQALDVQRLGRAAEALQTALLQSAPPTAGADPVIRIFSAWPAEWSARFQLLARGGFVVDSSFDKGTIQHLRIHSLAGAKCRLVNPWPRRRVALMRDGVQAEVLEQEALEFPTTKEEMITIAAR